MTESTEQLMLMPSTSTSTETENVREVPEINRDDFKLGKVIGRGAFGTVHQGIWRERAVAIKRFDNLDGGKSFDIEVKQLSRFENCQIIELFGIAVDEEHKYIIMEYADGGSLDKFLHCDFKPMYTARQGLRWALDCAKGLRYLHMAKPTPLLHRDLKPDNLLLTADYKTVKIGDFGTVAELKTKMTGEIGTARYMAPEVFRCAKYNEKCDVYSLGILFWEILTRQIPFEELENSFTVLFQKTQNGLHPPTFAYCPPAFTKLLESCWHQDPEKRPTLKDVISTIKNLFSDPYFKEDHTIRNQFPSIPCVNLEQLEMMQMIDIKFDKIVYTGKFSQQEVSILEVPPNRTSKFLVWIQQYLQFKHENVISILDIVKEPLAVILDCADLIPLHIFLHGNVKLEYSRAHALSWAHQCAEGMAYLQHIKPKPFLRCALNPLNLYLTLGGLQIKIGDLESHYWNSACNPLAYEAPEVCEGFTPNEKSDAYSWAIVLWELLTRKKPFDGCDIQKIIKQIMDGVRPAIEDDWLEPIKELMQKCWEKEPKKRPTIERVASQMATFDKDHLTPIVLAIDVQRIQNSKPVIDKKDFDEETRSKMSCSDHYKYILSMWKDQKIILARINLDSFREFFINYSPFHIKHQNIVSTLAITRELDFLILEFAEDGPLDKFLHNDGKTEYTIDHALSWAQQLAEGLAYLLTRQLRLRTFIPSDLLLSNKCRTLKIIPLTVEGFENLCGNKLCKDVYKAYGAPTTVEYIDQWATVLWTILAHKKPLEDLKVYEKRTVYNWGIIVWEILTRRKAFEWYSEKIKIKTKASDRPPISENWPESIKNLMEKCWDSDPEKRPKMQEVAKAMKQIMVDFPGGDQPIEQEHKWGSDYAVSCSSEIYDADNETDVKKGLKLRLL